MKKYLPIAIIILGVAAFAFACTQPWSGKYFKLGGQFLSKTGMEILYGNIALAIAGLSIPLGFYRRKWVALTGLIVVGLTAVSYVIPPVEGFSPMTGLHIAVAAAGLIFVGGIMAKPKR
jgi:hypothetical protein